MILMGCYSMKLTHRQCVILYDWLSGETYESPIGDICLKLINFILTEPSGNELSNSQELKDYYDLCDMCYERTFNECYAMLLECLYDLVAFSNDKSEWENHSNEYELYDNTMPITHLLKGDL